MKAIKMTSREWALYNLLKQNPDKWYSKEEIVYEINVLMGADTFIYNVKCWDKCSKIREDMIEINASKEVDKIIVLKDNHYKIANEEEVVRYLNKKIAMARRQERQVRDLKKKILQNGQGKLLSNQEKPIDINSKARAYHETYVERN